MVSEKKRLSHKTQTGLFQVFELVQWIFQKNDGVELAQKHCKKIHLQISRTWRKEIIKSGKKTKTFLPTKPEHNRFQANCFKSIVFCIIQLNNYHFTFPPTQTGGNWLKSFFFFFLSAILEMSPKVCFLKQELWVSFFCDN